MSDQSAPEPLDERRLQFEQRRWAEEQQLRTRELDLRARESAWTAKLLSPLTIAILGGVLTAVSSMALEWQRHKNNTKLEKLKHEGEMIVKVIGGENANQVKENLLLLTQLQLIGDPALAQRIADAAPSYGASRSLRDCLTNKPGASAEQLIALMATPSRVHLAEMMAAKDSKEAEVLLKRARAAGVCP